MLKINGFAIPVMLIVLLVVLFFVARQQGWISI